MHRLQLQGCDSNVNGLLGCCRRKAHPDPDIAALVEQSRRDAGLYKGKKPPMTPQVGFSYPKRSTPVQELSWPQI